MKALCSTPSAKAKLAEEGFSTSADEIERRLSLMNEMRSLLMLERDFPDGGYPDPAPLVAKIRVEGSYLLAAEADQLRKALVTVGAIAEFILGRGGARYPRLWELSRRVTLFPEIVRAIDAILDDRGEVKDSASPELQQVRRAIREREGQAAKRLQQVLQRAKQAGIVDADAVLSVRDGRPVIPVAAANKRKLQGFIHDESATGRTFYVEPVEVVEINNELKELEYAERREVVKVLSAFTESIRPDAEAIADAGDYLSSVDMIRAKARWALANDAGKPILSTDDRLELRTARHPLLQQTLRAQGREIVPLDLALDRRKHILVISGPNAGGKSVCLKTTGLMQYLFQCGYPVPASEVSELPVFRSIFIDIGDEQSIDDDLSTYSSHLRNMKKHAGRCLRPHAGAYRRVWFGYRADDRRRHRRGDSRTAARTRLLRGRDDALRQHQIFRLERRRGRQRRDALRRAADPSVVQTRNRQARQFVRRGDRPQDRSSGGDHPCGERQGGFGSYQPRTAAARDRPRQTLLGAEARPHPPDRPQDRGAGTELCRATGAYPSGAERDSACGQGRSAGVNG